MNTYQATSAIGIEAAVRAALAAASELDHQAIHLGLENGRLLLEGVVDCARDRELAEHVAQGVPGVHGLENRLRVVKPEPAT
jgi:osmotically-inducible protein OsmY